MTMARVRAAAPYAVLLLGAAALYLLASRIDYTARPGQLGPDFWPKLAIGLIAVICLVELVKAAVAGRPTQTLGIAERLDRGDDEGDEAPARPTLLAAGIVMTLAYGAVIGVLGFPVSTFLYLVLFMYVGGFRSHAAIWLSSLVGVVLLTLVFLKVVYVSLPRGTPPFDRATDLLTGWF